jgi:membrane protein
MVREISSVAGTQIGETVRNIVRATRTDESGVVMTVVSVIALVLGATSVFAQLQESLNTIWRVKPKEGRGLLGVLKDRFWTFTVVFSIGFLLLVSLVFSAALAALAQYFSGTRLEDRVLLWCGVNWLVGFGMTTVLFAMIYKLLPDARIAWNDVWVGAAVTALLFDAGKYLIGLYLGQASWISAYGAAGSLVLVLLWVYYSSQLVLFGAEFTQVYARRRGQPLIPTPNAERATAAELQQQRGQPDRPAPDGRERTPVADLTCPSARD